MSVQRHFSVSSHMHDMASCCKPQTTNDNDDDDDELSGTYIYACTFSVVSLHAVYCH